MSSLKVVPGSFGYPIIGEKALEFYRDPVNFIVNKNQQYGCKFFVVRFLNNPTVFVSDPHCIKELLASEKSLKFAFGYKAFLQRIFGNNILFESDAHALYLRKCLKPFFSSENVYKDTINRILDPFIQSLNARTDAVPVYEETKHMMTRLSIEVFLGLDATTSDDIFQTISELATTHWHGIISVPLSFNIPMARQSSFSQAIDAKERLLQVIREALSKSKSEETQKGQESLLQEMIKVQFPDDKDLEQHILLFLSALIPKAFASIVTSFLLAMSGDEKKEMRERARMNDSFLDNVLLEVQRLWPPLFGGRRIAKTDCSLAQFKIPKDYAVVYVSQVAQRDESVFPQASTFLPDRWSTWNENDKDLIFCFGAGPRCCIGRKVINDILHDVTKRLLSAFNWHIFPDNQDLSYKYLPVARPVKPALIKFTKPSR